MLHMSRFFLRDVTPFADDRSTLLPTKNTDLDEEIDPMVVGHGNENATISSAIYNLSTTIIGAGIMGLPAKMKVGICSFKMTLS